jgi:hypothetical protein
MAYGTLTTLDTLRATYQSVALFGEDRAYESIQAMLDAHNEIMQTIMTDVVERTTDRLRRYGTADTMVMTKGTEMSRADAQKILPGAPAGFPLEAWEATLQWTRKYFQNATVAEVTGQFLAMRTADIRRVIAEVQRAIFTPTNYNFDDYLVDHLQQIQLPVRALLNADGLPIPAGPNGETFNGATHTHYLATASLVMSDMVAVLETVLEHYNSGQAVIYINRSQEATVRTFTPNFVALQNTSIWAPTTAPRFNGPGSLQTVPLYNRLIGEFNGAEVWVKPWIPAGYIFVFLRDQPKPLCLRTRTPQSGDLVLVADDERYPLRAKSYEREFGVGIWNRTNGAVLYTGGGTFVAPAVA